MKLLCVIRTLSRGCFVYSMQFISAIYSRLECFSDNVNDFQGPKGRVGGGWGAVAGRLL